MDVSANDNLHEKVLGSEIPAHDINEVTVIFIYVMVIL